MGWLALQPGVAEGSQLVGAQERLLPRAGHLGTCPDAVLFACKIVSQAGRKHAAEADPAHNLEHTEVGVCERCSSPDAVQLLRPAQQWSCAALGRDVAC